MTGSTLFVQIIPYRHELWPAVQTFLREQYPDCTTKAEQAYFMWKYAQHPAGSALPAYALAMDGDSVVGQLALMADGLWANGYVHSCYWLTDLVIAESHRQTPLVWGLFDMVMQQHPLLMVSGTTERLRPLYARLGWRTVTTASSYYQLLRPGRSLHVGGGADGIRQRWRRLGPLLATADAVLPAVWAAASAVEGMRFDRRVVVTAAGADLELLFSTVAPQLGVTQVRSRQVYDWKTTQRPVGRSVTLAAYQRQTGRLLGSAIVKVMVRDRLTRWVEVVDILAAPDDQATMSALLLAARRLALHEQADFLHCRCSWPALEAVLRTPQWIKRPSAYTNNVLLYARDGALADDLLGQPWMVMASSGDTADTGRDEWPVDDSDMR